MSTSINEHITFGEMKQLTERFNQIMGASLVNRDKRLDGLIEDICQAYGYECNDQFVIDMFRAVWEARHGVIL